MDVAKTLIKAAKAQEKVVKILERCQTPDEVRKGFLEAAEIMSKVPGQETLVRSLRIGGQPGGLDDGQVINLRQGFLQEFPKQAAFLRQSAKDI